MTGFRHIGGWLNLINNAMENSIYYVVNHLIPQPLLPREKGGQSLFIFKVEQ